MEYTIPPIFESLVTMTSMLTKLTIEITNRTGKMQKNSVRELFIGSL